VAPLAACILCVLGCGQVPAQTRLDPSEPRSQKVIAALESEWSKTEKRTIPCRITPYPPRLGFELRLWSGYEIGIPIDAIPETETALNMLALIRVQPKQSGLRPEYLVRTYDLPELPASQGMRRKLELSFGGGFFLGAGKYRVDLLLIAADGRSCTKSWDLKAGSGSVKIEQPPNTVASAASDEWKGFREKKSSEPSRVTVLVHAAPVVRRRHAVKLSPWDREILLDTLIALLDRSRFTSARVTAFDLESRRVLFDTEEFTPRAYRRLQRALAQADLATVPYSTLKDGPTPAEFLLDLVRSSNARTDDTVVFVGPAWRPTSGGKPQMRIQELANRPNAYQIALLPFFTPPAGAVNEFVRWFGGRVLSVYKPSDLASAIAAIDKHGSRSISTQLK